MLHFSSSKLLQATVKEAQQGRERGTVARQRVKKGREVGLKAAAFGQTTNFKYLRHHFMAHKRRRWTLKIALPTPPPLRDSLSMIISSKTEQKKKKRKKYYTHNCRIFRGTPLPFSPPPASCHCSCYSPLRVGKTKIRPLRHLPNAPCPQLGPRLPGYSTGHSSSTSTYNKAWLRERESDSRVRPSFCCCCCERFFGRLFVEIEINVPEITSSTRNAWASTGAGAGNGFFLPWALASWYMFGNFCQAFVCRWLAPAISLGCPTAALAPLLSSPFWHNNCQFMARESFQLICHTTNGESFLRKGSRGGREEVEDSISWSKRHTGKMLWKGCAFLVITLSSIDSSRCINGSTRAELVAEIVEDWECYIN